MNAEKIVQTDIGKFRIKIVPDISINPVTREPTQLGYRISVGGKKDTCVYITTNTTTTAELHNLNVKGLSCEITGKSIRGIATIHMLNLAFTIVKEVAPHVTHIHLMDNSSFQCDVNGSLYGVSIALYELVFHQSTWYERHFGAVLENPVLRGLYTKTGFYNNKPIRFEFNNSMLNEQLGPIYERTRSWKEFFDEIYHMNEKCKIILPWYRQALINIMDNISYENQSWIIDLSNPKIQTISYSVISSGGGKRRRTLRHSKRIDEIIDMYKDVSMITYSTDDFRR